MNEIKKIKLQGYFWVLTYFLVIIGIISIIFFSIKGKGKKNDYFLAKEETINILNNNFSEFYDNCLKVLEEKPN